MNSSEPSSQPLPLTSPLWIALALIAMMGLAGLVTNQAKIQTLGYLDRDDPVVVRSAATTHHFPALGISIALPSGWSYLAVTDDVLATRPTFVNESAHTIVRIHASPVATWPDEVEAKHRFGDALAQWIRLRGPRLDLTIHALGGQLIHTWDETDPRMVGRLIQGESEVTLIAVTHGAQPPYESLRSFCAAVAFIEEND